MGTRGARAGTGALIFESATVKGGWGGDTDFVSSAGAMGADVVAAADTGEDSAVDCGRGAHLEGVR